MKKTGMFLSLVLVLALALSGCGLFSMTKESDDSTVVAEFNGGTITKAEAMAEYEDLISYYEAYGYDMSQIDAAQIKLIKEDLLDYLCENKIVRIKADELGLTALSDDEKADLTAEATASFEEAVDYYRVYVEGATEEEQRKNAIEFLAQQDYTLEGEIDYAIDNAWQQKLMDSITADVVPTEADVQAAYEQMILTDEEAYQGSPYDFEYAMATGETVTWVPEGYRTVKHILIPFTEDQVTKISDLTFEIEDIRYRLEGEPEEGDLEDYDHEHYEGDGHIHDDNGLILESDGTAPEAEATLPADAQAPEEEAVEPVIADPEPEGIPDEDFSDEADYYGDAEIEEDPYANMTDVELTMELARLTNELSRLTAQYAAALQPKVDEVRSKISTGADFDQLIAEYGADDGMNVEPTKSTGYYISAASEMYEESFTKAAMALQKVGDISEPVIGMNGIHIIRYDRDVQPGPVALDSVRAQAEENALATAKDARYMETVEKWVSEANVKRYADRMK